jgi:hypothetical protein
MKKFKLATLIIAGTFLVSLVYSCVKDGLAKEPGNPGVILDEQPGKYLNTLATDSSCSPCVEFKTTTVTPANFFGPYLGAGLEMTYRFGRATIGDIEIQANKKLNVTVINATNAELALPAFFMAADGSYEIINYARASSVLMIYYVRFNGTTGVYTYKPVNNLTVKYSITGL